MPRPDRALVLLAVIIEELRELISLAGLRFHVAVVALIPVTVSKVDRLQYKYGTSVLFVTAKATANLFE
jgi:hypothetical protein